MITQGITLQSEAEARDHATHIGAELLRQAAEDMRAQGWDRDDFDRFLRDLLEE